MPEKTTYHRLPTVQRNPLRAAAHGGHGHARVTGGNNVGIMTAGCDGEIRASAAIGDDVEVATDDLLTERLLRVIDEGRRTATYKLALLLALIDGVAAMPGATELPTRRIAANVLAVYYPQTRTYVANDGISRELRQITMKGSPPLRSALRLRLAGDATGCGCCPAWPTA
jgi:hypothetical protein